MHSAQPNQPKNVSFSLRKIEERTAEMTTDRAPRGVWEVMGLVTCDRTRTSMRKGWSCTDDDDRFDEGIRYGDGELGIQARTRERA